jgi:signal transduction histidine kinase
MQSKSYRSADDITESKLLASQLAHAQKMESIGHLAAGIAHEINTPTQYIGDNTRFLKEAFADLANLIVVYRQLLQHCKVGALPPDLLANLETALAEAEVGYLLEEVPKAIQQSLDGIARVSKIVQALKEFSHPGTEEKVCIDINRAIENTLTVARNEWKYVAEVITDFDLTLPMVPCLPGELNQVILNIVINAAHTITDVVGDGSKQKGQIRVSTRRKGNCVEIRISDTGKGIPEAIRSRVFDPFFTTKEVGKGTGQGLAMAHSTIVDKHQGSIHFETEIGQGTTFILRLPLVEELSERAYAA